MKLSELVFRNTGRAAFLFVAVFVATVGLSAIIYFSSPTQPTQATDVGFIPTPGQMPDNKPLGLYRATLALNGDFFVAPNGELVRWIYKGDNSASLIHGFDQTKLAPSDPIPAGTSVWIGGVQFFFDGASVKVYGP